MCDIWAQFKWYFTIFVSYVNVFISATVRCNFNIQAYAFVSLKYSEYHLQFTLRVSYARHVWNVWVFIVGL
jgi:hypothetical protein